MSSAITRAPIALANCVPASPTGPWPKIAMRVVAGQPHPPQRAVRGARAAGDRRTGGEAQLVRQRHQRVGRHLQVLRVAAMRVAAVHLHRHLLAELLPAGAAVVALRAALVVVHHHALADARLLLRHAGPDGGDNAARFVAGDHRIRVGRQAGRLARSGPSAGGTDAGRCRTCRRPSSRPPLRPGLAWDRGIHHFQITPAGEYDTTHGSLLSLAWIEVRARSPRWRIRHGSRRRHRQCDFFSRRRPYRRGVLADS